jgi:hypothetical protein
MSTVSRHGLAYLIACLSFFVAGTALARPSAPRRLELVTLRVRVSEPGMSVAVETADKTSGPKGRLVLRCESVCDEELPHAHYKLTLKRGDATPEYDSEIIQLKRSMQFTGGASSSGLRVFGVTLLIAGGAVAASGFIALLPRLSGALGDGGVTADDEYAALTMYGFIAAASGGVLAVVGLLLYWTNRLVFEREKLPRRANGLSMQLLPTASGASGVVTGRF